MNRKKITLGQIRQSQNQYGIKQMQDYIDNGLAWKLEGSFGRSAMAMLESGACMLPTKRHVDAYGSTVPSRYDLKSGTKGTFKNSQLFWEGVENGEIEFEIISSDEY